MSSTIEANVGKSVITSITTSGHVLNTSCVKWSQNNWIAIVINKYIYVLSSRSDPYEWIQQFPYHKSVIPNPTQTMVFDCGLDFRQVLAASSADEQQILMLEPTLTTETVNSVTFHSYRRVEWSPICRQLGCLLAALTLDHRLVIYRKDINDWELTIDLSLLLNQKMKELWTEAAAPDYQLYRQRMYSLATTALCWAQTWTQNSDSDKYEINCMLYMGSKNGLITFWSITIPQSLQLSTQLVYKWDTDFEQINCLKSFDEFLLISSSNGLVSVIFTGFALNSKPNPLSLWSEVDNICVNEFAVKTIDRNSFDILFTKSDFVIICRFSADTNDDKITMSLKCCKSVLGLHRMPSTAICSIVDSKYLLTSLDGRLIEIQVSHDLSVTQSEVTLDSVSTSAMCSHGVDGSPNGTLSALVQSLSPYHDHLAIKEPIQVVIFANISFDYLTNILYENYLCEKPIPNNAPIEDCFDYFDCIRSFLSSSQNSTFDTFLFTLIDNQKLITDCNDLLKLRIIRFITRAYITNYKSNSKATTVCQRLESNAQLCEDMILKLFIQELYTGVVCSLETLTESQLQSIKNMNQWLWKRFGIRLLSTDCFEFDAIRELCPICKLDIEFDNRSIGSCPQSHRFKRCTNSLVLCDFVNYKYEKCFRCFRSIVIKPSVWSQSSICLYCG